MCPGIMRTDTTDVGGDRRTTGLVHAPGWVEAWRTPPPGEGQSRKAGALEKSHDLWRPHRERAEGNAWLYFHPFHLCQGSSSTEPTRSYKAREHLDVRSVSLWGQSPRTLTCWGKGRAFQPSHPFVSPPCVTDEPLLASLSAHPSFSCATIALSPGRLTISSNHSCPT